MIKFRNFLSFFLCLLWTYSVSGSFLEYFVDRNNLTATHTVLVPQISHRPASTFAASPKKHTGCYRDCETKSFECTPEGAPVYHTYEDSMCEEENCEWQLHVNLQGNYWAVQLDFQYDQSADGHDEALRIYDGFSADVAPLLASFYSDNYYSPLTSSGPGMALKFSNSAAASRFNGTCKAVRQYFTSECPTRLFYASENEEISSRFWGDWNSCTYKIKFRDSMRQARLRFHGMNITDNYAHGDKSYIEASEISTSRWLGRYSGSKSVPDVVSTTNEMAITIYQSKTNAAFDFNLSVDSGSDLCSCSNTTAVSWSGRLTLPSYPRQQYCNDMTCVYYISVSDTCTVDVTFDEFYMAQNDHMYIYDGTDGALIVMYGNEHDRKSGFSAKSKTNGMTVKFVTDSNYVSTGFNIRYAASCGLTKSETIALIVGVALFFGLTISCIFITVHRRRLNSCFFLCRKRTGDDDDTDHRRGAGSQYTNSTPRVSITVGDNDSQISHINAIIAMPPPTYQAALAMQAYERPRASNVDDTPPPPYEAPKNCTEQPLSIRVHQAT